MPNKEYIKTNTELQYLESQDVTKLKGLDNKFGNVNFLLKHDVFEKLALFFNCTTDNTYAYVPTIKRNIFKTDKNNKELYYEFQSPNADNNFADLIFDLNTKNKKPISIKCSRVKTLHTVDMDGRHLTFTEQSINDDNYILFYSMLPQEVDKILLVNTKTYYDIFLKYNSDEHFKLFDINYVDKLKSHLKLTDRQLKLIDLSESSQIDEVSKQNIEIKRNYAHKTYLDLYKKDTDKKIIHQKTHYGYEYVAVNIKTNQTVHFRDSIARNNFMSMNNIKLSDNHNILRNCKCMNDIVNNIEVESCRTNINDDGWIIMSYHDKMDIEEYVKTLLENLQRISILWRNRINKLLKSIGKTIKTLFNNMTEKLKIIFNKYKKENQSYKPFHLWNFRISKEFYRIIEYFEEYPRMNRLYRFI